VRAVRALALTGSPQGDSSSFTMSSQIPLEKSSSALTSICGRLLIGSFDLPGAGLIAADPSFSEPLSAPVEPSQPKAKEAKKTHNAIQRMGKPSLAEFPSNAVARAEALKTRYR
jgi:hypothetical protein